MAESTSSDSRASEDETSYSVVRVETPVTIQVRTSDSMATVAEQLFDWLNDFKYLAGSATRFLRGIDFTQARYELSKPSVPDDSDEAIAITLPCLIWVVADDTKIALERCANWCAFAAEGASIARAHGMSVPEFSFQSAMNPGVPYAETMSVDLAEIMFPAWRTWSDSEEVGRIHAEDLKQLEAAIWDRRLSFRSNLDMELIGSLEEIDLHLSKVNNDPYHWRWIIEGIHSAVQNAMVSALAGTWDVRTLRERAARKLLQKQHSEFDDRLQSTVKLDDFLNLYSKIKDPDTMGQFSTSKAFEATATIDESISWLAYHRNLLKHFRVQTVDLDASLWPEHCNDCLMVVRFLVEESNNIVWHSAYNENRAISALTAAQLAMEGIRSLYSSTAALSSNSGSTSP